jgi:hypothetical protein
MFASILSQIKPPCRAHFFSALNGGNNIVIHIVLNASNPIDKTRTGKIKYPIRELRSTITKETVFSEI